MEDDVDAVLISETRTWCEENTRGGQLLQLQKVRLTTRIGINLLATIESLSRIYNFEFESKCPMLLNIYASNSSD